MLPLNPAKIGATQNPVSAELNKAFSPIITDALNINPPNTPQPSPSNISNQADNIIKGLAKGTLGSPSHPESDVKVVTLKEPIPSSNTNQPANQPFDPLPQTNQQPFSNNKLQSGGGGRRRKQASSLRELDDTSGGGDEENLTEVFL